MARRASSSLNPGIILGAAAAIVVAVFAGKSFLSRKSSAFGDAPALNIEQLLENGNGMRGSTYVVRGQIDEKLQWTANRGQLISLRVETPGGDEYIGIEIPPEFNKLNIDTKQKFAFLVKIRNGGRAVAEGIERL
jgi:hypothetical protein